MIYGRIRAALLAAAVISFAACGGGNKQPAQPAPAPAPAPAAADTAAPADTTAAPADGTAAPADGTAAADTGKVTDADMEKAVTMFESMAKAAKDHVGDCDAQAAGMQSVLDENKEFINRMNKMGKDPEVGKAFQEKYGERMQGTMMGMMSDLQACQGNENVQKVFQQLQDEK